ncbi:LacI family DNA-binding transcriptional regulator [Nocardioides sp. YIM 152315]|uniref:LacI family DNA-binding transcriptional regulator n=1 Tax=Nocardioides sp. YIM 152315 TaxID=3031760 RepID=UPI0023DB1B25|nr:LacI family DNA-binding transcriptional regulator [Nocardioides sp. YIM 152315]MDF1605755.1 LacI family DNA-binding transcriptional regulator [Nocardioides sp. YIM 152315]
MSEVARRATLRDVAETAGVSRSTASRALSGRGYVAEPVRKKVLRTAEKLGYVPDVMARNLKQQVSRSIGILVTDLRNQFYADLAAGASQQARLSGYTTMLVDDGLSSAADDAAIAEAFVALRVGGVILTPTSAAVPEYLARHRVPIVEVDRQFTPDGSDGVVVDNAAGARAATEHLLELGHRRIALFIDETDWTTGRGRYDGYVAALGAAGVAVDPDLVVATGWDVEGSRARAVQMLGGRSRPTAVFAANNVLAEGAWRAIAELGLSVPGDISLVAFDDAPWMSMVTPGVTAVAQDSVEMGAAAVRRLLARLEDPVGAPQTTILDATLRTRGSTGPL